jgi:glycogen operon protein
MRHWPGTPYPLGATWDGGGTNFAVFSEAAEAVELCLFEEGDGPPAETRIELTEVDGFVCGYLPDVGPGGAGTGCTGRTTPATGHRCNPASYCSTRTGRWTAGGVERGVFGYSSTTPPRAYRQRPSCRSTC